MNPLDPTDEKWIQALKPYLGGGIVPLFRRPDGTVDAEKTIAEFCKMKGWNTIE